MLVHIFTLKFHAATERFDDEEFQAFIKDKEVLSVREHFFLNQTVPYLVLIVTYLPGVRKVALALRSCLPPLAQFPGVCFAPGQALSRKSLSVVHFFVLFF